MTTIKQRSEVLRRIPLLSLKMVISSVLWLFSPICLATANGPYLGLQLGWGMLNQGEFIARHFDQVVSKTFPDTSVGNVTFSDTGRGGRIFFGYQFNPYLSAEIGYYRFSRLTFDAALDTNITVLKQYGIKLPFGVSTDVNVRTDAFDLVGKASWPVTQKFSVYGKLGLAALNSEGKAVVTIKTSYIDVSVIADPSVSIIYPTFGLGMSYDITSHVSGDLSWNRIQKINPCPYPSIDFVAVALMYHFST
jgi:opacity protein-like surface antigen